MYWYFFKMTTMNDKTLWFGNWPLGGSFVGCCFNSMADLLSSGKEIFGKSPGSRGKRVA